MSKYKIVIRQVTDEDEVPSHDELICYDHTIAVKHYYTAQMQRNAGTLDIQMWQLKDLRWELLTRTIHETPRYTEQTG